MCTQNNIVWIFSSIAQNKNYTVEILLKFCSNWTCKRMTSRFGYVTAKLMRTLFSFKLLLYGLHTMPISNVVYYIDEKFWSSIIFDCQFFIFLTLKLHPSTRRTMFLRNQNTIRRGLRFGWALRWRASIFHWF